MNTIVGGYGCIAISGLAAGQRKMQGWITILIAAIALLIGYFQWVTAHQRSLSTFSRISRPPIEAVGAQQEAKGGRDRATAPPATTDSSLFLPHTHRLTRRRPGMAIISSLLS